MKIHKRVAIVVMAVLLVSSLVGCSKDEDADPLLSESKDALVTMVNATNEELVTCYERIAELEELLVTVKEESGPTSAITEMSDGTGRKTFNTVDGMFTLPVEFKYPNSVQAPNTSAVNISEAVKLTPTANWVCRLTGTTLELSHTSGIAGTISVGYLDREAQKILVNDLQGHLDEMLNLLPIDTKKSSSLFLKGTKFGVDNISHTFVDEKDAMIRCGMLGYGDMSLQYFFVYTGEQDAAKDEVVLSLIKTMSIWNLPLGVE